VQEDKTKASQADDRIGDQAFALAKTGSVGTQQHPHPEQQQRNEQDTEPDEAFQDGIVRLVPHGLYSARWIAIGAEGECECSETAPGEPVVAGCGKKPLHNAEASVLHTFHFAAENGARRKKRDGGQNGCHVGRCMEDFS
jgi:hypothetical protein